MFKLFDVTMVTGDQTPLFQQVEAGLKLALAGQSDQFLYNIDHYYSNILQSRASVAERARQRILKLAEENTWKGNRNDLVDGLTDDYLSIFQTLEDYVVVGIDMEADGFPTALYTRSIALLNHLHRDGMLEEGIEPGKYMSNLIGTKTHKSITEGNFVVQRLDVTGYNGGKPCFRPVTPKSNLDIGGGKQFVVIPVPFMYMMESMIRSNFTQKPFRFIKSSVIGQVTHIATISGNVVRDAYSGLEEKAIHAKVKKTDCGYNVAKQRFYAYDLESSLSSLGVASFRPEMLDSITAVNFSEVDKSRYNVDFTLLRGIFKTRVKASKVAQLDSLNFIDLKGFANVKDKQQAVIEAGERETDKALYFLMKSNPEVFGDIEEGLATRERLTPKFLKGMDLVELPEQESQRVAMLNHMLDKGVVRFTANSKSSGVFERTVTNNRTVLERMLGKDYVKNFESIRNKLYFVKELLERGEINKRGQLEKVAVEFNLLDYVDQELFFSAKIDAKDTSDAVQAVNGGIEILKQKAANRSMPSNSVLYRNIYATEPGELFGNVNVNMIIAIEYSEV